MPSKRRKEYSGVITLHKPVPPHLLYHTAPRSVGQKSSSAVEGPYVRSATRNLTRFITHPGSQADTAHTRSPCSLKHLMDHLLSEQQEVEAITQPLLDTENGFIKDLEHFLNHVDMLRVRRHELLHKRWTECVWWPIQCSVERRFKLRHCEGMKPTKILRTGYDDYSAKRKIMEKTNEPVVFQVSTILLKDPLFLYLHSRLKENTAVLHCQTGCVDDCQWMASEEEQDRNKRDLYGSSRSRGPVYMATADGRCFRPGCWSANYLPRSYSVKS
ncbi:protein FAM228A [Tachysurus vachellii]|uniref:protein FAM228A n=1 Tax=Tachysurus vachellii TaxID=175792 RepID=UPI00296AB826|nr:protein FAM228A [Tachysurus vachellii]